ncbi:UDP-galactose transporter [Colletotrichum musicola]|uniref:UDP-galactose transporter n=1 Tax=Colletotrichum musicola TaxID=2175873 RepID=A0A8H6J7S1_9PEZI|nr:UDP-galactose transporter [Colletotrichum musicola]
METPTTAEPNCSPGSWAAASSLTLLLHRLQQPAVSGGVQYDPLTVVILSEALKLVVSTTILALARFSPLQERGSDKSLADKLRDGHLKSAAPALLYTIATTCQSIGARHLESLPFVVLSQLKLTLTPIFSLVILRQALTLWQWACLAVMTSGMVLVQPSTTSSDKMSSYHDTFVGVTAMLVSGTCVALAGVWMETMLKSADKFVARNTQLAGYSLLCGGFGFLTQHAQSAISTASASPWSMSFFRGFHPLVWGLVLLQAVGGFIVAWSVQATSTVAKNYAQALGFLVASAGPAIISAQPLQLRTWIGISCVLAGVVGSVLSRDAAKTKGKSQRAEKAEDIEMGDRKRLLKRDSGDLAR